MSAMEILTIDEMWERYVNADVFATPTAQAGLDPASKHLTKSGIKNRPDEIIPYDTPIKRSGRDAAVGRRDSGRKRRRDPNALTRVKPGRRYPLIRCSKTGYELPNGYIERQRKIVDPDFSNENWGDDFMMPLGDQPSYRNIEDFFPDEHRLKDGISIWQGLVAEAEAAWRGERQLKSRMNSIRAASTPGTELPTTHLWQRDPQYL